MSPFNFGDELFYKTDALALFRSQPYPLGDNSYPPLYPLVLAPAFLFGDEWYDWMIRINVLVSSLTIVPVWLIARELMDPRRASLAVVFGLLIPYHVVFPRLVMSENLYLPLFLAAVYQAVADRPSPLAARSVALGVVLALCQLTRHLNLVAVPILVLCYVAFAVRGRGEDPRGRRGSMLRQLGVVSIAFVAVYAKLTR